MNHIDKKYVVWTLVVLSAILYAVLLLLFPPSEINDLIYHIKLLPTVVTGDLIFIFLFVRYIWKWKIFYSWLIPIPNLQGTWKGQIESTWKDPITGKSPEPIPVILTIKQSLLNVSCVMRTQEMESFSFVSDYVINQEKQILQLVYSYKSYPKQTIKDRSPEHSGTIIFSISIQDKKELVGDYWTGRKTTGTINLEFWKKERLDKYPTELGEHPVSKIRK